MAGIQTSKVDANLHQSTWDHDILYADISSKEMNQAGGKTLHSEIHELKLIWNKEELPSQRKNQLSYQSQKG
jgi:hypothetical protein